MKQFRDISNDEDAKQDVDIASQSDTISTNVETGEHALYQDIEREGRDDLYFGRETSVQVGKKVGKNFDALEKQSFFSSLLRRDVVIKGEKRRFSFERIQKSIAVPFQNTIQTSIQESVVRIKSLSRKGLVFLGLGIFFSIFVLGFFTKSFVENRVNAGYSKLLTIREGAIPLDQIQKNINNSRFDLLLANTFFTPFKIFPWEKVDSAGYIIAGGRYLTRALDDVLGLYTTIDAFIQKKPLSQIYFTQLFTNISPQLQDIELSLEKSLENYKAIEWLPDEKLEEQRLGNIVKIEKILSRIQTLNQKFPEFLNLLGHEKRKRYLIVFQNADEIRPTGGFMGSMGLLEIFRGRVQLFQKKDVYAIEWDLKTADYARLDAPKGISELTDKFGLRDANYYANLKDSSEAIKFFTDSAGMDIDGIIYINQNTLLHFLDVTGPVYFPALSIYITSENFSEMMSLVVEAKVFQAGTLGTPKQVLFDFMEIFTQKLVDEGKYFDYLQTLIHDVESRDIMMWSFDSGENSFLTDMNLNGKIDYDQSLDFTYPVYTSLSGNKSDRYMQRSYSQTVTSGEKCSFNVNFEIESKHGMTRSNIAGIQSVIDQYKLDSPNLLKIQGASKNRQFVRVLLPTNATIIPRDDFVVVDYGDRRGLEFFLDTQLSETSFYNFEYILENPECKNYDYTLYKQPGIPEFDVFISIDGENYNYQDKQEDFYFEKRK